MYIYILKGVIHQEHHYIGCTTDFKKRLLAHNQGKCAHTTKYRPWALKNVFWFDCSEKAYAFEKYLKTGAGRAFSIKHF
jgi:predicted GIY-YIG superfamily endonuclease